MSNIGDDDEDEHEDEFQERLTKGHGSQCGYCTAGFVMSMYALLKTDRQPTTQQIDLAMEGVAYFSNLHFYFLKRKFCFYV